jgi:hypothetical protein
MKKKLLIIFGITMLILATVIACFTSSIFQKSGGYTGAVTLEYEVGVFKDKQLIIGKTLNESIRITNGSGIVESVDHTLTIKGLAKAEGKWTYATIDVIFPGGLSAKTERCKLVYKGGTIGTANSKNQLNPGQWISSFRYVSQNDDLIIVKSRIVELKEKS